MAKTEKIGIVVSNKMDKSVVVEVEFRYRHPIYSKTVVRTKRYMAHDEANRCTVGDKVIVEQHRPISRRKRWLVKRIVTKSMIPN